jgi:hypothetical protein
VSSGEFVAVGPGGVFVVVRLVFEAAVEDADEAVGDDEVLLDVFGADGLTKERVPLDAVGLPGDS